MKMKKKRWVVEPMETVLEKLASIDEELVERTYSDRSWLWIATEKPPPEETRKALRSAGWVPKRRGFHVIETKEGDVLGKWGHHCEKPLRFRPPAKARRGGIKEDKEDEPEEQEQEIKSEYERLFGKL